MKGEISAKPLLNVLLESILAHGDKLVIDGSFFSEISDLVRHDTLEVESPEQLVMSHAKPDMKLLDFGCGIGGHRKMLESFGYDWIGLNYKDGMATGAAAIASSMNDDRIVFYDGVNIPFEDETFDLVYSFQTFEHIQDIGGTFREISRVLKPHGKLIGAVSYLEQIHDYSTFNFTPYGFKRSVSQAGLKVEVLYPRSDVFSWMLHRLMVVTSASDETSIRDQINAASPFHKAIGAYALRTGDMCRANLIRLMFSSHFSFSVIKQTN